MARDNQNKLTPKEEADLKVQEEKDAEAALAAEAAAKAAEAGAPSPPVAQPKAKAVGDIPVTCLKTESNCMLGNRRYQLVKGQEIEMDPSHAEELASGGWVAVVNVIQ